MNSIRSLLAVIGLVAVAAVVYQQFKSDSLARKVDDSARTIETVQAKGVETAAAVKSQGQKLETHGETLKTQGDEIAELKTRLASAEGRLVALDKEIAEARGEVSKLKGGIEELRAREAEAEQKRRELDGLRKELEKRLIRDQDFERRLQTIERQLGVGRPQP